jgi:hypothetical protein
MGSKAGGPCRNILLHAKDPYSMKDILVGKIHGHFSTSFSASLLDVFWLLPGSSGGRIMNDQKSVGETQQISSCRSVWGALCDTTP